MLSITFIEAVCYHVAAILILAVMAGREDKNARLGLLIYICANLILLKQ